MATAAGRESLWRLKGAGNANLVFGYTGPSSDPLAGLVLRVRKRMLRGSKAEIQESHDAAASAAADHAGWDWELWRGTLPDSASTSGGMDEHFTEHLRQWIGSKYLARGVPCTPPPGLLESLQESGVCLNDAVPVQLLQDYTLFNSSVHRDRAFLQQWRPVGPVLCAEIKPKAGCLPASWPGLALPDSNLHRQLPRFVLHALLKAVQGKGELYGYNPMDLFSGHLPRVEHAITCLLAAPNNNVRLFVNGKLVWGASVLKHPAHLPPGVEALVPAPLPAAGQAMVSQQGCGSPPFNFKLGQPPVAPSGSPSVPSLASVSLDPQVARARLHQLGALLDASGLFPSQRQRSEALRTGSGVGTCMPAGSSQPAGCPGAASEEGAGVQVGQQHHWALQALVQVLAQLLVMEPVLAQIKAVQLLDKLGVEAAADAYAFLRCCGAVAMSTEHTDGSAATPAPCSPRLDHGIPHVKPQGTAHGHAECWGQVDVKQVKELLRGYLTATTAKDCGVMLTLQRVEPTTGTGRDESHHVADAELLPACGPVRALGQDGSPCLPSVDEAAISLLAELLLQPRHGVQHIGPAPSAAGLRAVGGEELHFAYQVTVLDLDLKSVAKITSHLDLEQEIVACAKQHEQLLADLLQDQGTWATAGDAAAAMC